MHARVFPHAVIQLEKVKNGDADHGIERRKPEHRGQIAVEQLPQIAVSKEPRVQRNQIRRVDRNNIQHHDQQICLIKLPNIPLFLHSLPSPVKRETEGRSFSFH